MSASLRKLLARVLRWGSAVSLLLTLAIGVLWWQSHRTIMMVEVGDPSSGPHSGLIGVGVFHGRFMLYRDPQGRTNARGDAVKWATVRVPESWDSIFLWDLMPDQGGFAFGIVYSRVGVGAPMWMLFVLGLTLPLLLLARIAMKRRRTEPETACPTCGYDLRASPTRCPECGTPRT